MKNVPIRVFLLLLSSLAVAVAMPPAQNHPDLKYVEGEAIVTFKPSVSSDAAQQILAGHSLGWQKHFTRFSRQRGKQTGLVHSKNKTTTQLIGELSKSPEVETVEPNYLRWVSSATPNDTQFANLWALKNTGVSVNGTTGTGGDDIRFVEAWSLAQAPTSNPPVVAVIDSGVDYTHPDLAANMWINPGENPSNGLDNDSDGYVNDYYGYDFADNNSNPSDSGYHGTHVSGTIAATGNNGLGVIGVDYQARIMALRASNDGTSLPSSAIIEAIQYATMKKNSGVNIVAINESFGGGGSNNTERAAMQAAGNAGIIFCVAAGNATNNNDITLTYPASYRLTNMIVVAASDQNDALGYFSNYGSNTVDVAAPGVNILSLLPTTLADSAVSSVQQGSTIYAANELEFSGNTVGVTGTVYFCGLGNPGDFPVAVTNNIALIQRGTLNFSDKVSNAMSAGARAVIIYNNVSGNFSGTLGAAGSWIPAVSLSQADGLAQQTNSPATVAHGFYQYLNGTSMATPHVSGAVAFAAMNFPSETVTQRIQRILANADAVTGLKTKVHGGRRLNLQRTVDTDTNGLPDWWELKYFGQQTGTSPNADLDHDGMSNLAEWIAGTIPTNAVSTLRLTLLSADDPAGVVLNWPSVANKTYRLERATNLLTGFNSIVRTNITATAPVNTETDTIVPLDGARYYRIGVEQ